MCNTSHDLWPSYSMPVSESKVLSADKSKREHSAESQAVIGSNVQVGGDSEQPERNVAGQDHTRRFSEALSGAKRAREVLRLVRRRRAAGSSIPGDLVFTGPVWYKISREST
jgi:hypothetical protein